MDLNQPSKDFSTRYSAAKRHRDNERPYIEEVLMFCRPGRETDFTRHHSSYRNDETQVFISIGEEVSTDLASDLVTYFTPPETRWAKYELVMPVPKEIKKRITDQLREREGELFTMLMSSNYADIANQITFEAASHGTPAMWVELGHISQPLHVEPVPPHELLITPGHMGYLDRFREKWVRADSLDAVFRSWPVTLTDPKLTAKRQKPGALCKVTWGFWLDWTDPGNPLWRCEITVDDMRVTPATPLTLGPLAGACPLLVGRFNPQPGRPWGRGPGRAALPDFRVLDRIEETVLSGMEQAISNTIIYPNDGVLDLSDGIEAGRAYAARRDFTRDRVFELNKSINLDYGFFSKEQIEERIRTLFYQNGPRQRGETPPTAAQWLDERRRVQQRLGKPAAPLWTELYLPFIQRIELLGVQTGKISEAVTLNGQVVAAMPVSPLQKAQNQDALAQTRANLELAFAVFQDQVGNFIDPVGTFKAYVDKSGDELTVVRDEEVPSEPPAAG